MTAPIKKNESWPLIEIIESLGETEWRKGSSSEYSVKEKGRVVLKSQEHYPPSVSFRFKQNSDVVVSFLKDAVNSYSGKVKWVFNGCKRESLSGMNFVIEPIRLGEVLGEASALGITPKQYLAEHDPGFGPVAFSDLAGLAEHVRKKALDLQLLSEQ